jgi:hypothetical protein
MTRRGAGRKDRRDAAALATGSGDRPSSVKLVRARLRVAVRDFSDGTRPRGSLPARCQASSRGSLGGAKCALRVVGHPARQRRLDAGSFESAKGRQAPEHGS